mmetsp:Transcript_9474/g.33536  ORF Transcript_9474/g.33536 Transcript_9474/m.33536 type:complete len:581 (-) Transcript_9474:792-2534(-)
MRRCCHRAASIRHVFPAVQDLGFLDGLHNLGRGVGLRSRRGRAGVFPDDALDGPDAVTVVHQVARDPSALRALAADCAPRRRPLQPLLPQRVRVQSALATNHNTAATGAGKHHVQTTPIGQETHLALSVVSNGAKDNYLLLLTLEAIDGLHLEAGAEFRETGPLPDQLLDEVDLALIGRHETHVFRHQLVVFADLGQGPQRLLGLCLVDVGGTFALLLTPLEVDEGNRHPPLRPREGLRRLSGDVRDAILQAPVVEGRTGELRDQRMHTVLSVQQHRAHALRDQTCEQRLAKVLGLGHVGQHGGRQLTLVTDEDDLLAAPRNGHQRGGFCRLGALIDEHGAESCLVQGCAGGADTSRAHDLGLLQLLPSAIQSILFDILTDAVGSPHTDNGKASLSDAFDQIVHCGVTVRGDQHGLVDQSVLHQGRDDLHRSRGLSCAGWSLDERDALCARQGQCLELTLVQARAMPLLGLLRETQRGLLLNLVPAVVHGLHGQVLFAGLGQRGVAGDQDELPELRCRLQAAPFAVVAGVLQDNLQCLKHAPGLVAAGQTIHAVAHARHKRLLWRRSQSHRQRRSNLWRR